MPPKTTKSTTANSLDSSHRGASATKKERRKLERKDDYDSDWSYGLSDCCARDPTYACFYCFCYPCGISQLASEIDDFNTSPCFQCCCACVPCYCSFVHARLALRNKLGIPGSGCDDCFKTCFLPCCVACQMRNELDRRVFLSSKKSAPATEIMQV